MGNRELHSWQVSTTQAMEIQRRLAAQVAKQNEVGNPRFIAGADISARKSRDTATAAVVVLEYPELKLVDSSVIHGETTFPYVPGLLSFRESPLVLRAYQNLRIEPDLVLVDGQGVAHPRRMGLASHLGLWLDKPTIGCAKSLLIGNYEEPGDEPGSYTEIMDEGEVIGAAVRTKSGVKPVFVSIGHKVDLPASIHWVLACCRNYRIPEPLRLAHQAAGGNLKRDRVFVST